VRRPGKPVLRFVRALLAEGRASRDEMQFVAGAAPPPAATVARLGAGGGGGGGGGPGGKKGGGGGGPPLSMRQPLLGWARMG